MPYPNCTGAIEECLNCRCTDCRNDRVPSPIRVDDFVKGDNIWERAADHKSARKKQQRTGKRTCNTRHNTAEKRSAPCSAATETGRKQNEPLTL